MSRTHAVAALILLLALLLASCGKSSTPTSSNPVITSLSATTAAVGSADLSITVTGTGFTSSSVVQWNGTPLTTKFVGAEQLTATIPSSDFTIAGTFPITVTNGSTPSNTINFTVTSGTPVLFPSIPASITVGNNLQVQQTISLASSVPAAGVDIVITSPDSSKVTLSTSPTTAGTASVTIHATGGTTISPIFFVQGMASSGSITLALTATGFQAGSINVTLAPSGFVFTSNSTINTTPPTDTTSTASDIKFTVGVAALDSAGANVVAIEALRAGVQTVNLNIGDSDSSVGTITTNPLVFDPGTSTLTSAFHPLAVGTTNLTIPQPSGFATPSVGQTVVATVALPSISIVGDLTIGKDLESQASILLSAVAPTGGTQITVSSSDSSKLLVSLSPTVTGTASVGVNVGAGTTAGPIVYLQALASSGSVTVKAIGANVTDASVTVNLAPSGFVITSSNITTFALAPDSPITVAAARLQPGSLAYAATQAVRPGAAPANVPITSSDTTVGTVGTNPLVFNAGVSTVNTAFHALSNGSTTISIATPSGFSTSSQMQQITASVAAGNILTQTTVTTGKDLQQSSFLQLNGNPSSPVSVTVTSSAPGIALVSTDPTQAGNTAVTINSVSTQSVSFYVQGVTAGTATLTIHAPGFNDATATVNVVPTGFVFFTGPITASAGTDTSVVIASAALNATTLVPLQVLPLRPGVSVQVALSSSDTTIGTIASPVTIAGGQSTATTTFHAVAKGTTTLSIQVPAGSTGASQLATLSATVQ